MRWRRVPHSKPGRGSLDFEIFGMAGVPEGMQPGKDTAVPGAGPC